MLVRDVVLTNDFQTKLLIANTWRGQISSLFDCRTERNPEEFFISDFFAMLGGVLQFEYYILIRITFFVSSILFLVTVFGFLLSSNDPSIIFLGVNLPLDFSLKGTERIPFNDCLWEDCISGLAGVMGSLFGKNLEYIKNLLGAFIGDFNDNKLELVFIGTFIILVKIVTGIILLSA